MTQQKVEITRSQDIVVKTVSSDSYNNLLFTDTEGGSYKVSDKRVQYFNGVIVPNQAVRLNFAMSSFGKEYIYSAVPAEQIIKAKEPVAHPTTTMPTNGKIIPEVGKNKSYALSYAKDLAVADKIKVEEVISWATVFDMYLRGDFSESESEIISKYIAKYGRKE